MDAFKYQTLTVEQTGPCFWIDIPDQQWDAGSVLSLCADVTDVCGRIAWTEEVRTIVIAFCGDIRDPGAGIAVEDAEMFRLAEPVARLNPPVIAAVGGDALGLGLELALACDVRIGTEGARFGLPHVSRGLLPCNGGTVRLPRLIGPGRAMQMILTGETIGSEEALLAGLLNRVVPPESLRSAAADTAREMAAKSPLSTSFAKEALYSGMDLTLDQGISKELDLYLQLFSTEDRTEGISAFREKRKPEFKGK